MRSPMDRRRVPKPPKPPKPPPVVHNVEPLVQPADRTIVMSKKNAIKFLGKSIIIGGLGLAIFTNGSC